MKLRKLIARLEALAEKEGDLEVGVHTPDYGSYACRIGAVRAGADGRLDVNGFGETGIDPGERVVVIFGK